MVPPITWFYLLAAVAQAGVSGLVFLARPTRLQNRLLALALFFTTFVNVGFAATAVELASTGAPDLGILGGLGGLVWLATAGVGLSYLAFLGTVETGWSRPLDSSRVRLGLAGVWVAALVLRVIDPSLTVQYAPGTQGYAAGAASPWFWILALGVIPLFGLVVAVTYWRSTEPGTLNHRKATAYAAAFGAHDLTYVVYGILATRILVLGLDPVLLFGHPLAFWGLPLGDILFALFATYGILSTQLFDIDLKIKRGISRSTVAAVFVAVFFVVSEGAQVLFADFAGNEFLGVLAAGALVFFLAPLQRLGERVSDAAMPGVEDTEAYRQERKEQIYRAQLEELMADEQVTSKERRALLRLQEDLGLDGDTASELEREVLGASGGGV